MIHSRLLSFRMEEPLIMITMVMMIATHYHLFFFFFFFFFFFLAFVFLGLQLYGRSQAGNLIGATAAGLRHSPQQRQILNPLNKARIEPATSWLVPSGIRFHCATTGTPTHYHLCCLLCARHRMWH